MRVFIIAAAAAVLLAACQTSDERQTASCLGYGYQAGTQQFADCKMTLDAQDRQERAEIQRYWREKSAVNQLQTQAQLAQPLPYSLQAGPRNTSCGWRYGQWVCRPSW